MYMRVHCGRSKPHQWHYWDRPINAEAQWTPEAIMSDTLAVLETQTLLCPGTSATAVR
jgi:hypothetical protein